MGVGISKRLNYRRPKELARGNKNLATRPQELTRLPQESCRKTTRTDKIATRILRQDQKNFLYGGWVSAIDWITRRPQALARSNKNLAARPQELTRLPQESFRKTKRTSCMGAGISKRLNYHKTTRTGKMQQESCRKTTRTDKITTRILPQDQKNFLYGGGY